MGSYLFGGGPLPALVPDDRAFADSLTDEQAAYLHMRLQGVMGRTIIPLREVVMHRVLDAANPKELRASMELEFFRPAQPVVAVPIPKRKRGKS